MKIKKINENIKIIQTRKYKDINVFLRFSIPYTLEDRAACLVLSKMLGEESSKYPSKLEMTRAKDLLYGISCNASCKARANILTFNVNYTFINPKFLDVELDEYLDFVDETLYHPIIDDKNVEEAILIITSMLIRRMERPQALANEAVINKISKDNPAFEVYSNNMKLIGAINRVTTADVEKVYKRLIEKAQLDVYLCGDLDKKIIKHFNFDFSKRNKITIKSKKFNYKHHNYSNKFNDGKQSNLEIVYTTPFNKHHKDYYAFIMGNHFLGQLPTSLLFENVREKLSLCYAIGISDNKYEGIVIVATAIDGKKRKIVEKEVNKQIDNIIKQNYDLNKFEISKTLFINKLQLIGDDFNDCIDLDYENKLAQLDVDVDEYISRIKKVTPDDLSRVFKQYKHYFTFMLEGKDND